MPINNTYCLHSKLTKENGLVNTNCILRESTTRNIGGGFESVFAGGAKAILPVQRVHLDQRLILHGEQDLYGEHREFRLLISGHVLCDRIIHYVQALYGKEYTNCSTMVEYLRTGMFRSYQPGVDLFAYSGGGNLYTGQVIRPGDIVWVFYYNKHLHGRRIFQDSFAPHYRRMRKVSRDLSRVIAASRGDVFSPEDLRELFEEMLFQDYHFSICIAVRNGLPIFIQQLYWHNPKTDTLREKEGIALTIGLRNLSNEIPACVFLSRGRIGSPWQQQY